MMKEDKNEDKNNDKKEKDKQDELEKGLAVLTDPVKDLGKAEFVEPSMKVCASKLSTSM
jgi:hypothetical protein